MSLFTWHWNKLFKKGQWACSCLEYRVLDQEKNQYKCPKVHVWLSIWKIVRKPLWMEWDTMNSRLGTPLSTPKWPIRGKKSRLTWWLSGRKHICQCRRHEFNPWSRKISHAAEQLSPHTITTEPVLKAWELQLLRPTYPRTHAVQQEKPLQWETLTLQLESSPCSPQLDQSPDSSKNIAQPKIVSKYMSGFYIYIYIYV